MKDLRKLKKDCLFQGRLRKFVKNYYVKETKKLIGKYQSANINNTKFPNSNDFNDEIWKKLTLLFWNKQDKRCAICEKDKSTPDGGFGDIDHYRPKSIYWWLAYNPYNYYLTCIDCNRYYKNNNFPLSNNQKNLVYPERKNIENERPLLLNPVLDNPIKYFQLVFTHIGKMGIVKLQSKENINKFLKEKADKTIEIFNLDLHSYEENYRDRARFCLLHQYYSDLIEIAEKRLEMDKITFISFLKDEVYEDRPELKTLDLLILMIYSKPIIVK